jgi:hypothetical protein
VGPISDIKAEFMRIDAAGTKKTASDGSVSFDGKEWLFFEMCVMCVICCISVVLQSELDRNCRVSDCEAVGRCSARDYASNCGSIVKRLLSDREAIA